MFNKFSALAFLSMFIPSILANEDTIKAFIKQNILFTFKTKQYRLDLIDYDLETESIIIEIMLHNLSKEPIDIADIVKQITIQGDELLNHLEIDMVMLQNKYPHSHRFLNSNLLPAESSRLIIPYHKKTAAKQNYYFRYYAVDHSSVSINQFELEETPFFPSELKLHAAETLDELFGNDEVHYHFLERGIAHRGSDSYYYWLYSIDNLTSEPIDPVDYMDEHLYISRNDKQSPVRIQAIYYNLTAENTQEINPDYDWSTKLPPEEQRNFIIAARINDTSADYQLNIDSDENKISSY